MDKKARMNGQFKQLWGILLLSTLLSSFPPFPPFPIKGQEL